MFRRLTALLVLLTVTYSSAEAVVGVLRDGAVHHESMAEAASHAPLAGAEHSHDGVDGSSQHTDHEHGNSSDHCTHQHGTPLTAPPIVFAAAVGSRFVSVPDSLPWPDRFAEPSHQPPRA